MYSDDMLHKSTVTIALFLLVGVCFAMSFVFLAPRDMVSNEPVYSDDYSLHYSNALAARTFGAAGVAAGGMTRIFWLDIRVARLRMPIIRPGSCL